jgi:hypothetical protein
MRFLSQRSAEMGLGVLVALAILLRLQPLLVEPQRSVAGQDFSDLRAGPPPRLRQRAGGVGIPARRTILAAARHYCRADGAVADRRRRSRLLSPGDRCRFCRVGRRTAGVLLSVVPPAVRGHRHASRGTGCRGRRRTDLFRRPHPLRSGRRPSASCRALDTGAGLCGYFPPPAVHRRGLARPRLCDPRATRSRHSRRDNVDELAGRPRTAGRDRRRHDRHSGRGGGARYADARLSLCLGMALRPL